MIVNIVIVAVLALVALGGIRTVVKNAHGESCCSGGNTEIPVKPADRNKKKLSLQNNHYNRRNEVR